MLLVNIGRYNFKPFKCSFYTSEIARHDISQTDSFIMTKPDVEKVSENFLEFNFLEFQRRNGEISLIAYCLNFTLLANGKSFCQKKFFDVQCSSVIKMITEYFVNQISLEDSQKTKF